MRDRARFAEDLSEAALSGDRESAVRVIGVTGMEGSGVRELAELLVQNFSLLGETPVLVPLRDFLWPEEEWLSGESGQEAQDYYARAFALELLVTSLLEPARSGHRVELEGNGADGEWSVVADPGDIIVLAGPFLMRSDVRVHVDYLVYVEPNRKAAEEAVAARGQDPGVVSRRYAPAEHMHAATRPAGEHADMIVDMSVPSTPKVIWKR